MATIDGILDPRWRKRIEEVGELAFEIEEMIRLGFLVADDLEKYLDDVGLSFDDYRKAVDQLADVTVELTETTREIERLGTIESALATIRSRRIARVKEERSQRRARKQADRLEREAAIRQQRRKRQHFSEEGFLTDSSTTAAMTICSSSWDYPIFSASVISQRP